MLSLSIYSSRVSESVAKWPQRGEVQNILWGSLLAELMRNYLFYRSISLLWPWEAQVPPYQAQVPPCEAQVPHKCHITIGILNLRPFVTYNFNLRTFRCTILIYALPRHILPKSMGRRGTLTHSDTLIHKIRSCFISIFILTLTFSQNFYETNLFPLILYCDWTWLIAGHQSLQYHLHRLWPSIYPGIEPEWKTITC